MASKVKTQFKVYAAMGSGMGWCVDTFDTLLEARRCADNESGAAYVRKVTTETVYRNTRRSPDSARPFRDILERHRPAK
ncbi:hypothetical protein vBDshSR4C_026 [Dinoroseobacter phage vB_DshS-R4C]|nr:hypothetical protein vBDshSR4C_026 [Dinoroseobacter phage vB_DshS-R4C]